MGAAEEMTSATDPYDEMEHLVNTIARSIVDRPEEIIIKGARGDGFVHYEVHCHDDDAGALIGTRGKYAEAIRMLLTAAASVRKIRVTIHIMPRDGDGNSRR